jgi:hypothetical protein
MYCLLGIGLKMRFYNYIAGQYDSIPASREIDTETQGV